MANEKVKFTTGQLTNLDSKAKEAGQVLFAIGDDNHGVIYFDKDNSTRIQMGGRANNITVNGEQQGSVDLQTSSDAILTLKSQTFIVGTATADGNWNGSLTGSGITSLYDGLVIDYWIPRAGASTTTLNLTLDSGQATGAKTIYRYGNTKLTTHYGVNTVIRMVYRSAVNVSNTNYEGWWVLGDYDSNSFQYLRYQNNIKAGAEAIVSNNIIVNNGAGYFHLKKGAQFNLRYPILWAGSNIAANGTNNNTYLFYPFTITTTQSITLTPYEPVFIKGTLSGGSFTPASTTPLTQTIPTAAETSNPHYILLGMAYTSTAMYLMPNHPVFMYSSGGFGEVVNTALVALYDNNNKDLTTYVATGSISGETLTLKNGNGAKVVDLTIPDKKVEQSATTTADFRPLVLGATHSSSVALTTTVRDVTYVSNNFYVKPSTGELHATKFIGNLEGTASEATHAVNADTAIYDSLNQEIISTYLADLTISNNNKDKVVVSLKDGQGAVLRSRDIPAASTTTAGVITANTTTQTITGPKIIDANGSLEMKGNLTVSKSSGFNYTGIEQGASAGARPVWFSYLGTNGKPVINNNFTYDPSTKTLTVENITGTVTSAIKDGLDQEITATYIKYGTPAFNVTSSTGTFDYTDGNNRAGQTALPIATDQVSGLMTAIAQTFAGIKTFKDRIVIPENKMGISFRENSANYSTGLVYGTTGNENLALVFKNNADSFMIVTNSDPASWGSSTWQSAAPSIHVKQKSLYVNTLIANGSNPSYNFQVTGTSYLNGQTTTEGLAPDANLSHNIGSQSFIYKELYTSILNLQRKSVATGGVISWYDKTFYNWYTYMQDAGAGHAPDGGKPSTLGPVTTWAIRSMIENNSQYGWIWEAKAGSAKKTDTNSAATPIMALSSNTGKLYLTNDLNIIIGDTDKFVHYLYNYANTGASWRAGVLGSGSGNTNYYVIQSTTSGTSASTWTNTLRIGQDKFDVTVGGEGSSFGIANTTTNTGAGISLYGGAPTSGAPNQGFFFAQTSAFGTHGKVTSDHALYSHITTTTTPAITSKGWIWRYNTTNVFSIDYEGYVTASKGMTLGGALTLKNGLEIDGVMSGTTYAYSGGGYNAAYNSIIMHGDATTGASGLLFCSDKTAATSINRTSDRAFIQFHPIGITTYTAEGTVPTEATSGEVNKLVIGVGNDSNDTVVIQTPGTNGLKHLVGTNEYTVLDSHGTVINNPNASNTTYSSAIDGYLVFSNTGDGNGVARGIAGVNGGTDGWTVRGYQTASNAGALELAVGDDGNEGIYVRQYTSGGYKLPFHNNAGANSGLSYRELILMAPSTGYTTIPQKLYITGDGSDISSSNANGGNLYIGQTTAQHLSFDTDEIASKTNASTMGTLKLQDDGGKVYIGGRIQGLISNAHYGTTASKGDKKYYKIGIKWQYAWMLTFTIRVYQAYNYFDLVISGYNYGSNNWYSPKASLLNASGINSLSVKFGYDSESKTPLQNSSYKKLWVMIPADNYTGLDIIDVTNGYHQATVPGDLFTIEEVIAEPDGTNEVVQQTINAMAPARISEDTISANTAKDNRIVRWDVQSGKPLSLQSSGVTIDDGDNVTPEVDQAANMGTASYRWKGVYGATIYGTSLAGTWLQGQNTENRVAFAVSKATDTGSYWPWMRQENSGSGKWFSLGILNNSFYIVGSATTRTANGVDHQWRFDVSNGMLSTKYLRVNSEDMSSVANATYDNAIPQALFVGVTKFNNRVYFANATLNAVGDDATLGDVNLAGHIGLKGINGNTGLAFLQYVASQGTTIDTTDATTGKITWNGSKFTINKPTEIVLSGVTSTTVNALYVAGRTQLGSNSAEAPNETLIHGKIVIDPQYSGSANSYNEGLRINRASNNWATIALGGAKDTKSGTGTDIWLIGSYGTANSDFYIRRNGSSGTTAPGINGGTNGFSVHNRLYINHTCGTDFNLSVNGNAQVLNGILYIDRDTTTANINADAGAASIILRVKATEQSNTQGGSYIRAFQTPTATNYNQSLAIWSTGSMFIGGGESANTIRAEVNKASGDENLYLCADGDVVFYPAADGKKCYLRLNSATLRPETNTLLDLGTTGQRWKTGYFNALDMGNIATNAASEPTGKITWAGGTDAADIYYQLDAADQGNLVFNMRDDANALTAFAYNGTKNIYVNPNTTSIYPRVDNSGNLGLSDHRWKNLYLGGGIRTQSQQALYVGSAQRSQWYKITLPEHGTATTTLNPEGSARWYMHSMTIMVGGDYNANPRGQIELKHYVYWNGSAWSLDKSYATMVGPDIEKIAIYYKLVEPFIIYINTSNNYSSIWVEHLQGLDTASNYDPLNTKVETIAAITVDANYTKVPTVSWGNNNSYKDGWYTPNSIVMVNNSSDNSRDAVLYIENQNNSDWAEKIYLNTNQYGLYIYGTDSHIAKFGANDVLHINDNSTVGNRNVSVQGRLDLNRQTNAAFGRISYYSPSYRTWLTYMSDASNGNCPTGGKPGSLGNVTSWAYRNIIENSSGYGWVWEASSNAAASANTTEPTVRMALSSYTGQLRIAPNASSTTCETGGLIIDSAKNGSSGNVAIELWRGANASWQIANESGTLHIRDNYNASGKQSTYVDTQISMVYNSGNITITKGSVSMANSIYITKAGECGLEVNNTQTTNPNQVAFIVGSSGNGGIFSRKHSKWIVYSDASGNVILNGNANTSSMPLGFSSNSQTSASWGDQTGTGITTWNDSSGGSIEFRKDNPSGGKLSIKVDGRFYGAEGKKPAMLMTYASSYWGMGDPDGVDTGWIRTTSSGIIPYQAGGAGSGHQSLGTSSWYFSTAYIDNVYGNATALRDKTNNTVTYLNYGSSGMAAADVTWLAAWDGYTLRAVNKNQLMSLIQQGGGANPSAGTANRMAYYSAANTISATSHWTNTTKLAVNSTSEPGYNFYVNGSACHKGNLIPETSRGYNLGDSSHYWIPWMGAGGRVHMDNLWLDSTGGTEYETTNSANHGLSIWNYYWGAQGNKVFGTSPDAVTIEHTTNSGSSWSATGLTNLCIAARRRALTTTGTQIPLTAAATAFDAGAGNEQTYSAGYGVRITFDYTKENRTFYANQFITYLRCYASTFTYKLERYSIKNAAWTTIKEVTGLTNTDQYRTLTIPATLYCEGSRQDRDTASYFNKLRLTLICTAKAAAGTANLRYMPSIGYFCVYGPHGPNLTSSTSWQNIGESSAHIYPYSERWAWQMARYNVPIHITDGTRMTGAARIGVGDLYVGDDLLMVDANVEKWSFLILGNSANVNAKNTHSQGRIRIYSAATNYHDIMGTSTTTAYVHFLPNANGWIATGGNGSSTGVGNATHPVYLGTNGVLTQTTYELKATVNYGINAATNAGTVNRLAYYSGANAISAGSNVSILNNYQISNSRNGATVDIRANGLRIWGATYGNTANQMLSNSTTDYRFGDGGPQIQFNTTDTMNSQAGAIIFTDHDSAGAGASFQFVTTESANNGYGGALWLCAPIIKARNQFRREGRGSSWIASRDNAILRETSSVGWHAILSIKTANGSWQLGEYNSSGWTNRFQLCYTTDANYNASPQNNTGMTSIYGTADGYWYAARVYNAVWNDYAEHRKTVKDVQLGQVVAENGNGEQHITQYRLEAGANITSDTYGTSMNETPESKTPIAVAGRVLAYVDGDRNNYKPGDAVCSGPNGTVSKMSRREIRRYPELIVGYVSEIPDYEIWHAGDPENGVATDIMVKGRIWIKVN